MRRIMPKVFLGSFDSTTVNSQSTDITDGPPHVGSTRHAMDNVSGIPSKRPAPFSFDYPPDGRKRPTLGGVGEERSFAESREIPGLCLETSHRGEPNEDPASLSSFLNTEASPRDISTLGSINESPIPGGSPNLLPEYGGTTFATFPKPERETTKPRALSPGLLETPRESAVEMEGCDSYSGAMDTDVDMICYGMVCHLLPLELDIVQITCADNHQFAPLKICGLKARLLDDRNVLQDSGLFSRSFKPDRTFMQTVSQRHCISLQLVQGTDMAVLDETTTRALFEFEKMTGCQYDLYAKGKELLAAASEHQAGKKNIEFSVSLVLYGPQESRSEAGRLLSKARQYLQHPSYIRPGVSKYDNPHIIIFPELDSTPNTTSITAEHGGELEVETLFDNLDHRGELDMTAISGIVTTSLKRYRL